MLDKLPAWARHAVVLCLVAPLAIFVGVAAAAVITAGGITGLDLGSATRTAVDAAAVSAAAGVSGWFALFITPLTRQYGVGSRQ